MPGAAAAEQPKTVQVNTRMAADLKERGDAVFSQLGYTPSQAVRALYSLAVSCEQEPAKLKDVLQNESESEVEDERRRREQRRSALRQSISLYRDARSRAGIDPDARAEGLDYAELKRLAYRRQFVQELVP